MYKKTPNDLVKHMDFIILDVVVLQAAFILAYWIIRGFDRNPYEELMYQNISVLLELVNLVVTIWNNTYKGVLKRDRYMELVSTIKHNLTVLGSMILFLYMLRAAQQYSRLIVGNTFAIYTLAGYATRIAWKRILRKKLINTRNRSILVVTDREEAPNVVETIRRSELDGFNIAGLIILDEDLKGSSIAGNPVVANASDAAEYVCKTWVDEVLVVTQNNTPERTKLVDELFESGVTVHIDLGKLGDAPGKRQSVEQVSGYTVITTSMNQLTTAQIIGKRMMDIAAGLVGCAVTGVIFLFVAPAIYISSPGPIFFAQERVGRNGKTFKMYKFRSMYLDAEARKAELMEQNKLGDGKMFKMDFDPRVIGNRILPDGTRKTGIGQFIRDTSLDEFPQFWNVLTGSMSLIGTRPPLISEVQLYSVHHRARLSIKPGITGMWQVSGRSDITDFEEVVALDREYINNWNFGLDLKILLKTILVVLKKKGSS